MNLLHHTKFITSCKVSHLCNQHNTIVIIIWHLHEVFQENKLRINECSVSLYLLFFMSELKAFIKLYYSTKMKRLSCKSGCDICITRFYEIL